MVTSLKSPHWSNVERPLYYTSVRGVLHTLRHLVHHPHLEAQRLSPSVAEAVRMVRRLAVEVLPKEMMELVQVLSRGKVQYSGDALWQALLTTTSILP